MMRADIILIVNEMWEVSFQVNLQLDLVSSFTKYNE